MKNRCKLLILFMALSIMLILPKEAMAATAKILKPNTVYKRDLNGGTKEKVRVTFYDGASSLSNWKLYVNNKEVYKYTFQGDSENYITINYVNVNTKDKYRELLITVRGLNSAFVNANIIRYKSAKKIQVIPYRTRSFKGNFFRSVGSVTYNGKNQINLSADSPFYNAHFGQYKCRVNAVVGSKYFYLVNDKTYKLEDISGTLYNTGGYYQLNRSMSLYSSSNGDNVKKTLTSGTRFKAFKIKPVSKSNNLWSLYVSIKTTDGDTGWIYFPNTAQADYRYNEYLVQKPTWG